MSVGLTSGARAPSTLAFDRLAPGYDALAHGDLFVRQRARAHGVFRAYLVPGSRVLEVGCGTGLDAVFMGRLGARVLACDASEAMIERADRRIISAGLQRSVHVLHAGLDSLPRDLNARGDGRFDAVVSNFGALNCIADLAPLAAIVRSWLRPGGVLLLGLIGRWCAWEEFYFVATRRAHLVGRRRQPPPVHVEVAGIDVPTFYHSVREVTHVLAPFASRDGITGLGVALPPVYLEPRWVMLPRVVREGVDLVDRAVCHLPGWNRLGDHVLLRYRRRGRHD
jgi:SAM-dependent methyltransferase